ncbi:MAG TPA: RNA polymerase sigma factor [Steroidobacteraceae bacterium]
MVKSVLAGDERAFNEFFRVYFPRIYRFALPRLGWDAEAAQEVVHLTFLKAIRGIEGFRGEARLFTWLCQICRCEVIDYVRAVQRRSKRFVPIDDNEEVQAAVEEMEASRTQQPLNQYTADEARELIQLVLDRLPAHYSDALEWKYLDGRSVKEIGEALGVGQTAAQSILARARVAFGAAITSAFGASAAEVLAHLRDDP